MQDVCEKTAPLSTAGPLRSHPLRPDLRVMVPGVGSGEWTAKLPEEPSYALPNEAIGFFEEAEGGARQAFANAAALVASNVLRLAYALTPRQEGENDEEYARRLTRADIHRDTYNSIAGVLNVKNLAAPGSFSEALGRTFGQALGGLAFETLPLATGIGEATLPAWTTGLAAKFPSLAAKIAPIVNGALTFGAQGALEPENPLRQAAAGATVGAILGATTPAGRFTRALIGAGLGYGQEAFANPNSIIEDRARNAILMGTFGALAASEGLALPDTVVGTLFDYARERGVAPESLQRAIRIQGVGPAVDRFAEDMMGRIPAGPQNLTEKLAAKFKTVTPEEFIAQRNKSEKRPFLSPYTAEDMKGWKHYLTEDGIGFGCGSFGTTLI
jgi:hypothetical protein